jgi:acyl-CoA thioesterase I
MFKNILVLLLTFLVGCQPPIANRNSMGKTIVCFGDSLTAGYGAEEGKDYPSVLGKRVNLPVINAGVSGDTTSDGLERLENDVLAHNPRMVIITLGANDFLRHVPKAETLRNMERIIDRIQKRGAMVVWATVKTGFFSDEYAKDFKKLAQEKRILLVSDVLKDIMFNPQYKSDQIHPNTTGYALMAERIYKAIRPLLK